MSISASQPFKLAVLGIALAGAVLALLFSAAAPASDIVPAGSKPKALWDPASVNETIQPGQTKTIPVTLTADKNLPDTLVQVSPEIAPFVTVSPITIGKTKKGASIALTLTVRVPIDTLPTTATGTVALQKAKHQGDGGDDQEPDGKIVAQMLPVSVNVVWPKATIGGINFSYPPSFVPETRSVRSVGDEIIFSDGEAGFIIDFVETKDSFASITDWADHQQWPFPDGWRNHLDEVAISNLRALYDHSARTVRFLLDGTVVRITNGLGREDRELLDESIFDPVLQSIKVGM